MGQVYPQRLAAQLDGEFVVFLIGMRINKPWKIHKWLPVFLGMPRMLRELSARPECGLLGYTLFPFFVVQYWRSYEHLERYARSKDHTHWPAWLAFNRRVGASRGDVGIWHETYCIAPGRYEAIYSGMPAYGLGKAGRLVPAAGHRENSRGRLRSGAVAGTEPVAAPD